MIRRILVPLDGSPYSETATRHACDFATRTGAEVFGKAITEGGTGWSAKASPHAQAARWSASARHEDREEQKHRLDDALKLFEKTCAGAGVTCHQAHLQGIPSRMMIEQSIFYDLIVTGFHGDYGIADSAGSESLGTLLGRSITPFLVVPRKYREIRNVLVCFDGSLPAMRALQDFAPVAEASKFDITILTAGKREEEARFLLKRAGNYLRSYGVENYRTAAEPCPIEKAVQEAGYFNDPVDLIVMGAHSRHTVRDFFAGSMLRDLLKLARVPLFLGQ